MNSNTLKCVKFSSWQGTLKRVAKMMLVRNSTQTFVASGSRVGGQAHVATRSARKSILMFPKISQMLTRVCQKICNLLHLSNRSTDHLLQIEREGQPPGMHQLGEKAWNLTCSLHIISRLILRKESKPCKTQ